MTIYSTFLTSIYNTIFKNKKMRFWANFFICLCNIYILTHELVIFDYI